MFTQTYPQPLQTPYTSILPPRQPPLEIGFRIGIAG